MAFAAIVQTPVPAWSQAMLLLVMLIGAVMNYQRINRAVDLAWSEENQWQYAENDNAYFGTTASGSYRSTLVVVVAIKTLSGRKKHIMIWRDSVSPADFSWLHIQLGMTPSAQLS